MTPFTSVRMGIPIEAYTEAIEDARITAERDTGTVVRWIYDIPAKPVWSRPTPRFRMPWTTVPLLWSASVWAGPRSGCRDPQFKATSTGPVPPVCTRSPLWRVDRAGDDLGRDPRTRRRTDRPRHRCDPGPTARRVPCGTPDPARDPPTSNLATRVVERIEDHPIRALRDAGVVVTVNSDDPPMFGTTLNREYAIAADLLDLDEGGLRELATTALDVV